MYLFSMIWDNIWRVMLIYFIPFGIHLVMYVVYPCLFFFSLFGMKLVWVPKILWDLVWTKNLKLLFSNVTKTFFFNILHSSVWVTLSKKWRGDFKVSSVCFIMIITLVYSITALVTTPLSASNYQVPGTGTITAGNTCTTVSISVTEDIIVEPQGHQFTVTITAVTTGNAAINPNFDTFSVTVTDNDNCKWKAKEIVLHFLIILQKEVKIFHVIFFFWYCAWSILRAAW